METGENCSAYSNPRYDQPTDAAGNKVTNKTHTHLDGDQCNMQISFAQLYGGGQGVYGATEHEGVTIENFAYIITYVYNGKLLYVRYVTAEENESDVSAAHDQAESNLKMSSRTKH